MKMGWVCEPLTLAQERERTGRRRIEVRYKEVWDQASRGDLLLNANFTGREREMLRVRTAMARASAKAKAEMKLKCIWQRW